MTMTKERKDKKAAPKMSIGQNSNKREGLEHYVSTFLKEADGTARKDNPVLIRAEHYEQIQRIIRAAGKDKVSFSDYIDNVLTRYFENHKDEIRNLLEQPVPFINLQTEQK